MTGAELRAGGFYATLHLNYEDGSYLHVYESALDPRVKVRSECKPLRSSTRRLLVGGQEFALTDWDGAAAALGEMETTDA